MGSCETECIICGAAVPLADYERYGVYIKVCDDCKKAVRYAKALYDANHFEPVLIDVIDNGDGTITPTKSLEQE